jgi:hypothetical protein
MTRVQTNFRKLGEFISPQICRGRNQATIDEHLWLPQDLEQVEVQAVQEKVGVELETPSANRPRLLSTVHNHASTSSASTKELKRGTAAKSHVHANTPVSITSVVKI